MKNVTIGIDLHGPIIDFERGFYETWTKKYPNDISVPLEKRKAKKIVDDYPAELREKVLELQHRKDFIIGLPEVPGAIEAIMEMMSDGYDVIFPSSPRGNWRNNIEPNFEWIASRFSDKIAGERVLIFKDKTLISCDILIDDNPVKGRLPPIWKQILFNGVNNTGVHGFPRMNGWKNWREDILPFLKTR